MGLATGLAAWLAAGGPDAGLNRLEPVEREVASLRPTKSAPWVPAPSVVTQLANAPLFALTVGPGAIAEPVVRLLGVSISKRRNAALLAVDGAAAEWLNVGESRGGVTLRGVTGSDVTLETVLGARQLKLGEQTGVDGTPTTANDSVGRPDVPPAGVRSPLPPASAPGIQ